MTYKKLTPKKRREFLQMLASTCNVSRAARHIGVSRAASYKLRQNDLNFAEYWAEAIAIGVEALEDEMHRRAFEGVAVQTKYGTYRKYSDTLAIFLMKAHKPEKYSDRFRVAFSGSEKPKFDLDDPKIAEKLNAILNKALFSAN